MKGDRHRQLQAKTLAEFEKKVRRLRILANAKGEKRRAGDGPGRCVLALLAGPLYRVEVQPLGTAALLRLRSTRPRMLGIAVPGGVPG